MKDILDLIGRVLMAFIFFYEAADYIFFAKANKAVMTEYGLTWNQDLLMWGAVFILLLGGLLLLVGYRTRFGITLLLLYWIPVTFIAHSFWNIDDEAARRLGGIFFVKNIAIAGGLLMVWANGVGKYSIRRLFATTHVPDRRR